MGQIAGIKRDDAFFIKQMPKAKTILKIGVDRSIIIELDIKFNKLQKFMWKKFFNIEVVDVKE